MSVKIGDVVVYKPTEEEKDFMSVTHNCNVANELPAFVVAVWSEDCINIKVMYDGAVDDLWKTSVPEGYGQGQWHKHVADGSIFWNNGTSSLYVQDGINQIPLGSAPTMATATIGDVNANGIMNTSSFTVSFNENGEPIYNVAGDLSTGIVQEVTVMSNNNNDNDKQ
jgi:hypothetical protein